jgi:hypothetical protein
VVLVQNFELSFVCDDVKTKSGDLGTLNEELKRILWCDSYWEMRRMRRRRLKLSDTGRVD